MKKETPEITPSAKKLIRKLKISLGDIKPTGKGGRIIVRDVQKASKERAEIGSNAGKTYKEQRRDYEEEEVALQLFEAKGFISVAAKKLGCTQQTVRNWVDRSPLCKSALIDARTQMVDFAERSLFAQIQAQNTTATIFYLKTQAKDRGYVEKTQFSFDNSETIGIEIVGSNEKQT